MNKNQLRKRPNTVHVDGDTATLFIRSKGNLLPCFVDTCDLPSVTPYTWVSSHGRAFHRNSIKGEIYHFYMHQLLLNRVGVKDGFAIDHIDRNPLNNRRSNLRVMPETYNNCAATYRIAPPRKPNRVEINGDIATVFLRKKGREIPCIIDSEDVPRVNLFTWFTNGKYALHRGSVSGEYYFFYLHQFLLGREFLSDGMVVDHVNRNAFDNRKSNLRVVTQSVNSQNMKRRSMTGLRGSYFNKIIKRYGSRCNHNGIQKHLGWYKTAEEAHAVTMKYLRDHDLIPVTRT